MSKKVIKAIAKTYKSLPTTCPDRIKAYGIVYNNTEVGGVLLNQHPAGKRVAGMVLDKLGYDPLVNEAASSKEV
ncbi:hypothetical protein M610_gp030 [Alteromonas phage vB_AmaP_AD45-P1]|uniref:hypothetical protein n=1 Tax=Alteromonas phage vB_AmaP_AD45-P1 TaxID=1300004 RepID=UPI0003334E97|nr:hypothetical protein M610_gp030 [Alteromonas phage vB_AmaP_AD45-P1]AGM46848.1 hypothetical protein AD45P1_00150 [Alteromonas phage vB_AmaP_AD45-P1]